MREEVDTRKILCQGSFLNTVQTKLQHENFCEYFSWRRKVILVVPFMRRSQVWNFSNVPRQNTKVTKDEKMKKRWLVSKAPLTSNVVDVNCRLLIRAKLSRSCDVTELNSESASSSVRVVHDRDQDVLLVFARFETEHTFTSDVVHAVNSRSVCKMSYAMSKLQVILCCSGDANADGLFTERDRLWMQINPHWPFWFVDSGEKSVTPHWWIVSKLPEFHAKHEW